MSASVSDSKAGELEKGDLLTHEAILEKFTELRAQVQQLAGKANDLAAEAAEHEGVVRALEQLDPDRKCFRQVGEVLVERNVAEVLPAVKGNKEQIDMIQGKLKEQFKGKQKELMDFQAKYKIRVRSEADIAAEQSKAPTEVNRSQGVLV